MRKTLLAIGSAVLVSMLLAPHGEKSGIEGWGPFFSSHGFTSNLSQSGPYVCFYYNYEMHFGLYYAWVGRVMIEVLALETVFLAVLFAMLVNIRWRPRQKTA